MNSPKNSEIQSLSTEPVVVEPMCDKHGIELIDSQHGPAKKICVKCVREDIESQTAGELRFGEHLKHQEEQSRKQAAIEARIGAAGIPARYREYDFDTFPGTTEDARRQCSTLRNYANRFQALQAKGISALLIGGAGTGKTGLACAVGKHIMLVHGSTVLFISAYGAVRHQRDTWGRRGPTEREALDDLLAPDLLILDEVGSSVGNETELNALFEVINGRYADRKPTFLLSNLPIDDYTDSTGNKRTGLCTYLGQRILDRFRDDGSFTLCLDWPSLRGAHA